MKDGHSPPLYPVCTKEILMLPQPSPVAAGQMPVANISSKYIVC